jgi:predicted RNA binding protein YcfA (HicA-like mRNA interferase family)
MLAGAPECAYICAWMAGPETNRSKVAARLARDGWQSRAGGRHDVYKHPARPGRIVVPRHSTLTSGVARRHRQGGRLEGLNRWLATLL